MLQTRGERFELGDLGAVGRQNALLDEEGDAVGAQQLQAAPELDERAGRGGRGIVGFRVHPINRHLDGTAGRNARQQLGEFRRHPPRVGEEDDVHSQAPRKDVQLREIVAQERLATGKADGETTHLRRLPQNVFDERGIHFPRARIGVVFGPVDEAVDAGVVAPLGQFDVELTEQLTSVAPRVELVSFELPGKGHGSLVFGPSDLWVGAKT